MSDYIEPQGKVTTRPYCPSCEPDTDPTRELVELRWCPPHAPSWDGKDDLLVPARALPAGSGECGGEDNRRWCELVHGSERKRMREELRRATA